MLSDARESLNRVKKGFFLVMKGSYTTFYIVKIRKMCEKKGKIPKNVIRNCLRENGNFSEKRSFRNLGPRKIFPSLQTRRQVSATAWYREHKNMPAIKKKVRGGSWGNSGHGVNSVRGIPRKLPGKDRFQCCRLA